MFELFATLCFIAGTLFRRWWGGWESPSHWIKVPTGFAIAVVVGAVCLPLQAALSFALVLGWAWLNPFHSWSMGMGFDGSGKKTWQCIAVMSGSYGAFTLLAAINAIAFGAPSYVMAYAPVGLLVSFPYLFTWLIFEKNPKQPVLVIAGDDFLGGPTTVGECILGALLLSGLPFVVSLLG